MRAIIRACQTSEIDASVELVLANLSSAPALVFAAELGVPTQVCPAGEQFAGSLISAASGVDLLCLAGYLRLIPAEVVSHFRGRMLNIHPSLLPKFGGKGMYGIHVHEAVLAAGEAESGCTVHRVSEVYDAGDIVTQLRCPVLPDDTAETLARRVLELEHLAYAAAIKQVLGE